MPLAVHCDRCGKSQSVPDSLVGEPIICSYCGHKVIVSADAPFGVQSPFTLPFASCVVEYELAPGSVLMAKDAIGNQLLERRILLHVGSGKIADVFRTHQIVEIAIDIAAKPLKVAQLTKHFRRNHQHALRLNFHHGDFLILEREAAKKLHGQYNADSLD